MSHGRSEPGAARLEKGVFVILGIQDTGSARPLLGLETETGQAELRRVRTTEVPERRPQAGGATLCMSPSSPGERSAVPAPRGEDSCQLAWGPTDPALGVSAPRRF